jgi:hypothetical protein
VADLLSAFLQRAAAEPFRFGEWDCCMTLANWLRELTGSDPAAHLRGRYASEFGWKRIVVRAGGLLPLVRGVVEGAGLRRVNEAGLTVEPGDVAVAMIPQVGRVGGIIVGRGVAMKLDRGLVVMPALPLAAWRAV